MLPGVPPRPLPTRLRPLVFGLLALILIFACSPTTQIQDSVSLALTQTQAARPTFYPTFTPGPSNTPYPSRTPLGGGPLPNLTLSPGASTEGVPPGGYPPPATAVPKPTQSETAPTVTATPTLPPTGVPTSAPTNAGGYPPPEGGGYPAPNSPTPSPASSTFTPTPTATETPSLTPSPTVDPLFTPSLTPITPSPTVTDTPNPNFSPTPSTTPTASTTPTRTLTPTRTPGPSPTPTVTLTPTPSLPDLTTLIMDTDDLNAINYFWHAPPENITSQLIDLGGEVCDVSCIGLEWTSLNTSHSLVFTAYRMIDFDDASQAAFSAQYLYIAQGFILQAIPPGTILPTHSWIASKNNQDFVIYTSQGPAVISFFWHATTTASPQETIALLATYAEFQTQILRVNGYITVNPNATPLP